MTTSRTRPADARTSLAGHDHVAVRRATPADAATVQTLVLEIAAHEGDLEHVHVTADAWTELLGRDDVVVLLAERAGRPLGYTSATRRLHLWSGRDLLDVDDVYVRPGERGAGIGRLLLVELARFADPLGLTMRWGVEPWNTGAQRFYRRLGATLRDKVVAGWAPDAYRQVLTAQDAQETR